MDRGRNVFRLGDIWIVKKIPNCGQLLSQPLAVKVEGALLEHRLAECSIADVALTVVGNAQAAIEIRGTHAVDETKAKRLLIPFVEEEGYAILDNPLVWTPITDNCKPVLATPLIRPLFRLTLTCVAAQP